MQYRGKAAPNLVEQPAIGLISPGVKAAIPLDASTRAQMIIDYSHHEIHGGSHYFNDESYDLPAADWIDIRFTTPDTAKWFHMLINVRTQEEGLFQLYENAPILVAGTSLTAHNSNRNSIKTSGILNFDYIVNTTEANANLDTDISSATRLRNSLLGSNQGNVSGQHRSDNEIIAKQNTAYLVRINNLVTSTRYVSWVLDWYEHTDKH